MKAYKIVRRDGKKLVSPFAPNDIALKYKAGETTSAPQPSIGVFTYRTEEFAIEAFSKTVRHLELGENPKFELWLIEGEEEENPNLIVAINDLFLVDKKHLSYAKWDSKLTLTVPHEDVLIFRKIKMLERMDTIG